jgi:flagellar basal-body rod protein FlgG
VVDDVTGLFTQGPVTPTGRPLDLAVSGTGFFRLAAADGTVTYTRAGSFGVDALGRLVSTDGLFVAPGITVPAGSTSVTVGADGTVTAVTPTGTQVVGQVGLTRFRNPAGLLRVAATRFAATPAAGPAADGVPGDPGFGTLQPSSLEGSNVDLPTELVNLILAQRSFQANTQAIQVESDLLAATAQLVQ